MSPWLAPSSALTDASNVAVGDWRLAAYVGSSSASFGTANTVFFTTFLVKATETYSAIGCSVRIAGVGVGQVARLGVYADAPGKLTAPSGAAMVDATVTTLSSGLQSTAVALTLTPARYWFAWCLQGAVTTAPIVNFTQTINIIGDSTLSANQNLSLAMVGVAGPLPVVGALVHAGQAPTVGLFRTA